MQPPAPTPRPPAVSVVVPLFNEAARLPRLLAALAAQTFSDFEIVLVDNKSTDETARVAAELGGPRAVLASETGRQSADAARNAGLIVARGDLLAFTDGDCVPSPSWLEEAVKAFAAGDADLVAGRIDFDLGRTPGPGELYDSVTFLQHAASVAERGVAFTANLIVARRVFERIGAFDVDCLFNGDQLFTRRAVTAGFKLRYEPKAAVGHRARTTRQVFKKAWLIAHGQGVFTAPAAAGLGYSPAVALFRDPKPHWRHLNPLRLAESLRREGRRVSLPMLAAVAGVAWGVAVVAACGFCRGRLGRWGVDRGRLRPA